MKEKELPGTGIKITPIAFGAWAIGGWFWGGAEEKESVRAVECAIRNGMTTIDTAPVYGFGQSEEFTGKAIIGKRDKVQIFTKFGLRWDKQTSNVHYEKTRNNQGKEVTIYRDGRKESIIKECDDSLRRLKTDYIDLYQQHWPDVNTPIAETMEALDILKKQGKILAGGVSNYSAQQMAEADKYYRLVSNQVAYSIVKRDIENELVPYCIANNKAIIAYSPLQRGILTGKITSNYVFKDGDNRPDTPYYKEPNLSAINQILKEIKPIADSKNSTLAQLAIRWAMYQPGITCVLAGARNERQVLENIKAAEVTVSCEEMKIINSKLNLLELEL